MSSELFEKKLREKFSKAVISPTPELWNNIEGQLHGGASKSGMGVWIPLLLMILCTSTVLWGFWNSHTIELNSANEVPELISTETLSSPLLNSPKISSAETASPSSDAELNFSNTSSNTHTNPALHTASKPELYTSKVLSEDLSERITHRIPQHTNQVLPESHISSETSSIFSPEKIGDGSGSIQHQLAPFPSPFPYYISQKPKDASFAFPQPELPKRKIWALIGYADFQQAARITSSFNKAQDLSFNQDPQANSDRLDLENSYTYDGLNAPGTLFVRVPEKSLSLGLMAEWMFHPKLSIQTGLEYGVFSTGNYLLGIVESSLSAPAPPTYSGLNLLSTRSASFKFYQLGIPLQLTYRILDKGRSSLSLYAGGSFYMGKAYSKSITQSANFYNYAEPSPITGESISSRNSVSSDIPGLIQYNPFNLSLQSGFTYSYHLSSKSSIFVGPQIKYQASPIYREQQAEINEIPYYLGLRLGFRFNK